MSISRFLPALLSSLLLIGCSTTSTATDNPILEPILGLSFEAGQLQLRVISTGCTKDQDFRLDVRHDAGDPYQTLAITRIKPDVCRAMPHEKTVHIDNAQLEPDVPVRLQNPFVRPPALKRRP